MSMELTEMEEFQRLVESAEPKEIWRKVLKKYSLYKSSLKEILEVDDFVFVNPAYIHKHFKYKKNEHGEKFFLYLDKEYQIMGILKGTNRPNLNYVWLEDWEDASCVEQIDVDLGIIVKNKKHLWKHAYHILMIEG